MSSLYKIALVASFFLFTGCGFHPMYGDQALGSKNSALRGNVAIDTIPGREGQILKMALEDRFNPESIDTTNAEYHLTIGLTKVLIPSVVKSDGTIQRYEVRFTSSYKLFKAGNPAAIFVGNLLRSGSYNVAVNANFATYEAEQDVIERTLQEMAEDYVFRISGYLANPDEPKPAAAATAKPAK